jgi:hypothetical protein
MGAFDFNTDSFIGKLNDEIDFMPVTGPEIVIVRVLPHRSVERNDLLNDKAFPAGSHPGLI